MQGQPIYDIFARHYDALMDDVDYAAWARYLLDLMEGELGPMAAASPWRVLDAACGTGNISIPLARASCVVTAADASESMLRIAQEKARRTGKQIRFIRQRLQDLAMPKPVDCITCACDGVNYLLAEEDLTAFLRGAYHNLRAGGLLLFDVSSSYKMSEWLDGRCYGEDRESLAYLWQNSLDRENDLLQMDLTLFVAEGGTDCFCRYQETHFQRLYRAETLLAALEEAGFSNSNVDAYGFMTMKQPRAEDERIQFVARKK